MKAVLLQAALLISSSVSDRGIILTGGYAESINPADSFKTDDRRETSVGRFALVKTQNFVPIRPPRRLGTAETGGSINLQVLPKSKAAF